MTALRQGGNGRRQGQALRSSMRQVLLVAALLTTTAYLSFKLGTHRQVRRGIREAAAAAPPPPRCAEQLANASAVLAPERPQKPDQVHGRSIEHIGIVLRVMDYQRRCMLTMHCISMTGVVNDRHETWNECHQLFRLTQTRRTTWRRSSGCRATPWPSAPT